MREQQTKTIDGQEYFFSQFGPKLSLKILTRLVKIAGEPLAIAISSAQTKDGKIKLDKDIDPDILGRAARALSERLDEDEVLSLIEQLTSGDAVTCDGKKVDFNSHYDGKLGHLFKVFGAALEVQYGNFFDEFTKRATPPTPPQAQPGQA